MLRLLTASLLLASPALADDLHALMRYPTLHGSAVVFVSHGNLWQVDRKGGTASRLTADSGQDYMPRFSPDGRWIALTASTQGNQDVYVIPSGGGTARRLTFHSDIEPNVPTRWGPDNLVLNWTPDSKAIVFLSRRDAFNPVITRMFTVPVAGGLPTALPLENGGLMSYAPDGHTIAYTPIFRDWRTWKRYDGGLAQDIYSYDFANKHAERITDWIGTDTSPMWYGHVIYFLSDRDPSRRRNIWAYDTTTKRFRAVTRFTDLDIEFPSLGDTGIVFQKGGQLYVIDLPSEQIHALDVTVPDDGTRTQPRTVDASRAIRERDIAQQTDFALSPNGERAAFSARGDIFTAPAEHGAIRDLTDSSNADDDHPVWSPDGRSIAYTTDASGAQQVVIQSAMGGAARALTRFPTGYYYAPVFSPGGKWLAFSDSAHTLWLVGRDGGLPTKVASDAYEEIHDQSFSPDGRWLAFSLTRPDQLHSIWLYEIGTGKSTELGDGLDNDHDPVFTVDGKDLAFISSRHENPTFSGAERDFATLKTDGIYLATLDAAAPSPFAPRSDEGAWTGPAHASPPSYKPDAVAPIKLDPDGLIGRAVPLPIADADITELDARPGRLFYHTRSPRTVEGSLPGEKPALHSFDIEHRKDETIRDGIGPYAISADGTKVLFKRGAEWVITDTKPQHADGGHPLSLAGMKIVVEPRQEWAEMFDNAWRLARDFFFSTAMNGVDWQAVHDKYAKLVPLLGSRDDLDNLIGQVMAELGNSHTYVGAGGDMQDPTPPAPTMLLGVDFALDQASGRYRFATIYPGDNSRPDYRGPLTAPGLDIHPGDYLLAVNGHALKAPTNPYSLFVDAGTQATLTIASAPTAKPRDVEIEPIKSELALRELAWIRRNREAVDRLSGGRIAYVYLSDMSARGLEQFVRQFYPQVDREALIVDERWNGGGFVDAMLLERLRRILIGMQVNRERTGTPVPPTVLAGPKVCLMNYWSASDGDIFPASFRAYGLGKLIGQRTWGGVRGIRGYLHLLDGGEMTVPEYARYGLGSQWVIENHGVDPDIEVKDPPGELAAGRDRQLETAVSTLMQQLGPVRHTLPAPPPLLPPYPPGVH